MTLSVHCAATNSLLHAETDYFAVAAQSTFYILFSLDPQSEQADTVLIFRPESATPVASVSLTTRVHCMCWGKTSIQEGRKLCLFCLTEKREIIQIVEGEVKKTTSSGMEENEGFSAFDEVFDVDKVEERANALKKDSDYSKKYRIEI